MTADELKKLFNDKFGVNQRWPDTYEVDHETYANVCQAIFSHQFETDDLYWNVVECGVQQPDIKVISVAVGIANKGVMFKNVELVLRRKDERQTSSS